MQWERPLQHGNVDQAAACGVAEITDSNHLNDLVTLPLSAASWEMEQTASGLSRGVTASPYGLSLLKIDTVTFHVPSAWRRKILRNLPSSDGVVPVTAKVPTA